MCAPWDTGCVAETVATAVSTTVLGQIATMVTTAEQWFIDVSASWWVLVPSIKLYPNAGNTDPNARPIDAVATLRGLILPITAIVAMGGMLWNGLLMVLSRKPAPLVNGCAGCGTPRCGRWWGSSGRICCWSAPTRSVPG